MRDKLAGGVQKFKQEMLIPTDAMCTARPVGEVRTC